MIAQARRDIVKPNFERAWGKLANPMLPRDRCDLFKRKVRV